MADADDAEGWTRLRGRKDHHSAVNRGERLHRRVTCLLTAGLIPLFLPVTGCANTCTAIGWFDELEVQVTGDRAEAVDRLEICFDGSCYSGRADAPGESPQLEVVAIARSGTDWTVSTSMQTPESIQLTAYSATGEVLAEQETDLSWKRVGGSARCGGPHEATASIAVGP